LKGIEGAKRVVAETLFTFDICPVTASVLQVAASLPMTDFEDAVQHACATAVGLDAIVTRNLKDFSGATLLVYDPAGFLALVQQSPPDDTSHHESDV
jgi:hypothetical protein